MVNIPAKIQKDVNKTHHLKDPFPSETQLVSTSFSLFTPGIFKNRQLVHLQAFGEAAEALLVGLESMEAARSHSRGMKL
jgi:indole-3-glycerol phosphate synthase